MRVYNTLSLTLPQGRGQAKDGQINESRSPLLFSILHGEGNEKAGEGANKLPLEIIVNFL